MGRLRKNKKYEDKLFDDKNFYINNPLEFKGKWKQEVFKNNNPLHIEIGCGKGGFINTLSENNPNINYIAIDKFPTVLYKTLIKINDQNKKNLKIVSVDAKILSDVFLNHEVDKIYLNFSDPWPKKSHEKNRLTNPNFLNIFFNILKPNGKIEFKTDNDGLFDYTIETLKENNYKILYLTYDLYNEEDIKDNVPTEYEIKWKNLGAKIKKVIFTK